MLILNIDDVGKHNFINLNSISIFYTWLCIVYYRLANAAEYLFQAADEEEMTQWVNAINQVASQDEGAAGTGRSQTLPGTGSERKDEPKKRSFFTLKKK